MPKPTEYDKTHLRNMAAMGTRIDRIFKKATEEAARIGVSIKNVNPDRMFSFADYPETKKQVDRLMNALQETTETCIANGVRSSWTLANNKNNALCHRLFGDNVGKLTDEQYRKYFSTNGAALEAFLQRKTAGLNLSDRVWKYTNAFKQEIELGLDCGIRSGKDAPAMARELKQYLQYPDKLFRRVRDEHGLLQLSKAAADFHPGRGVYRSSYKNARRLAATETNIAYCTSDHLRWQQMDFVVGIQVMLSNNHTVLLQPGETTDDPSQLRADGTPKANAVRPLHDICDELAGRYPKDFVFLPWHPHCRCHAVPILKTADEMAEDTQRILDGKEPTQESENTVEDVPQAFKDHVVRWREKIATSDPKRLPYYIQQNRDRVESILDDQNPFALSIPQEKEDFIRMYNNGEFKNYEDLAAYARKHGVGSEYYPDVEDYTDPIQDAIGFWQDEGDTLIHNLQRGIPIKGEKLRKSTQEALDNLRKALENGYETEQDMIVYRVTDGAYKYDRRSYFVSVSTSPEYVARYGMEFEHPQIQAFFVPKGTKCIVVGNGYKKEFELILDSKNFDFEAARMRIKAATKTKKKLTPAEIGEKRHAARTEADVKGIQQAWNKSRVESLKTALNDGLLPKGCTAKLEELLKLNTSGDFAAFQKEIKPLQQAVARHTARTQKQAEELKVRWDKRVFDNAKTRRDANRVLTLAKSYSEVDYAQLEALIAGNDLAAMETETKKVLQALKDMRAEERALQDLIPDVHEWHKKFTLEELKEAHKKVVDTMAYYKKNFNADLAAGKNLEKLKTELENKINYVENPGAIHPGAIPAKTWQAQQNAYIKMLAKTEQKIKLEALNAEYEELLTFKTTSKTYTEYLPKIKAALEAGDETEAALYINSAKAKKSLLEGARKGKKATKGATKATERFDESCFTEERKKKAAFPETVEEGDKLHFADAKNAYSQATIDMKIAADEYTHKSGPVTKMLRGIDGYLEYEKSFAIRKAKEIDDLTDLIALNVLKQDTWLVRYERSVFLQLKTGGLDPEYLLKNIEDYKEKIKKKYVKKYGVSGTIPIAKKKEMQTKIDRYKKWRESRLVGRIGEDPSFCSCGSYKDHYFSGTGGDNKNIQPKVRLEIYCPKGTQALYAAPFNYFNGRVLGEDGFWNAIDHNTYIAEAEVILQRGSKFRILEARFDEAQDRWFVKAEVIGQNVRETDGYIYENGGYKTKFK